MSSGHSCSAGSPSTLGIGTRPHAPSLANGASSSVAMSSRCTKRPPGASTRAISATRGRSAPSAWIASKTHRPSDAAARAIGDGQPFGARRRDPRAAMPRRAARASARGDGSVCTARARDRGRQPGPQRAGARADLEHGPARRRWETAPARRRRSPPAGPRTARAAAQQIERLEQRGRPRSLAARAAGSPGARFDRLPTPGPRSVAPRLEGDQRQQHAGDADDGLAHRPGAQRLRRRSGRGSPSRSRSPSR